jgi:RNA polymerase sigma-70 factor (ECF subfamily)
VVVVSVVDLLDLEAVYVAQLPAFRRVAAAITGDREAGLDAVQDAFAVAVRKRRRFRGEGSVEAWIWRIVVNSARSSRRRRARRERLEERNHVNVDAASALPDLPLEVLTHRQREVVFLRYYADLPYAEIGEILGVAEGTVGATLNTAHASVDSSTNTASPRETEFAHPTPRFRLLSRLRKWATADGRTARRKISPVSARPLAAYPEKREQLLNEA